MAERSLTDILGRPDDLKPFIRERLSGRERRRIPPGDMRESAVLLPVCWDGGRPLVILTRRSMDVEHHKGEISFPGGRAEPSDAGPVETALREAQEEIGLSGRDVDVLGLLDDHISIVGYHITPVVGAVPFPYDFRINSESESMITLPLETALGEDSWMAERSFFKGGRVNLYFLETTGGVVWGATARILKHFADILAGRPLPFRAVSPAARTWVMNLIDSQGSYRNLR
jgi:8-oxo-dGTP pyrophosphatase MutT (NUDIX family)